MTARRRETLIAGLAGLVFGIGLLISGMTDPSKVEAFLDLGGAWDPSLALVMGGAISVGLAAFAVARRRTTTLLGAPMQLPDARAIDRRLVAGSVLFGVGWGLAGLCPGPAIVSLGRGSGSAAVFVVAMLGGMWLFDALTTARTPAQADGATAE